jgi:hypothetical protein
MLFVTAFHAIHCDLRGEALGGNEIPETYSIITEWVWMQRWIIGLIAHISISIWFLWWFVIFLLIVNQIPSGLADALRIDFDGTRHYAVGR